VPDGRSVSPAGVTYTLQLRDSAITVQYAECSACQFILAFTDGRKPRAVASFAVDACVDAIAADYLVNLQLPADGATCTL
jgi:hypothetical protein